MVKFKAKYLNGKNIYNAPIRRYYFKDQEPTEVTIEEDVAFFKAHGSFDEAKSKAKATKKKSTIKKIKEKIKTGDEE